MSDEVVIRDHTPQDLPYIFNSFLRSYRTGCSSLANVPNSLFFPAQHAIISQLVKTSQIQVACSVEDSEQIFGYIIFESHDGLNIVHWINVKFSFRKFGICEKLIGLLHEENDFIHTHETYSGRKLAEKYGSKFNPFFIK